MFPFGHGLGYTGGAYESVVADAPALAPGEDLRLAVTVRNTGPRPGREIVQAYVAGPWQGAGRPGRVLGAFGCAAAAAGEAAQVVLQGPAPVVALLDPEAGRSILP